MVSHAHSVHAHDMVTTKIREPLTSALQIETENIDGLPYNHICTITSCTIIILLCYIHTCIQLTYDMHGYTSSSQ